MNSNSQAWTDACCRLWGTGPHGYTVFWKDKKHCDILVYSFGFCHFN